ncbi:MAG: phosphatase PAP2 family protein [Chthoniobacterales bacterium]
MDQSLFTQINQHWTHPALDHFMAAISSWDLFWPLAVIAGLVALIFGGFHGRAALVCVGLVIGLTDALVVDTMKDIVQRPRPYQVLDGVRILDLQKAKPRIKALAEPVKLEISEPSILPVAGNSFPSGHAANNFALATALAIFFRRGWLFFIPATLVAYSRVYVGSHYPSDILVASILGVGCALLALALLEAAWRELAPRWIPRIASHHPSLLES